MMKNTGLKSILYYKKEWMAILIALGGVLGLIGSYQYYSGMLTGYRLISTTVYSTIKLFFFAPTIPVDKDYSVLFEIAKWIAPLGTVIGIFSVFGDMYYYLRTSLFGMRKSRYVVVGSKRQGGELLRNILKREKKAAGVFILTEEEMAKEQEMNLLKKGIMTFFLRLTKDDEYYIREKLKEAGCKKAKSIVLFDDDLKNFGNFKALQKYLPKRKEGYEILMKYESEDVKSILESEIDRMEGMDIRFFNLEEAVASTVLDSMIVPERLMVNGGFVHILIVGFGAMGRALLVEALNSAVVHPENKIRFTIVDREISPLEEQLMALYPRMAEMADICWIEGDILSPRTLGAVKREQELFPIHLMFYTMSEEKTALLSLYRLQPFLKESEVAVLCADEKNAGELFEVIGASYSSLRLFGEDARVLSKAFIIDSDTRKEAMHFNAEYNANAALILGEKPTELSVREQWERLSTLKKESSIKQIAHRNTKRKLLSYYLQKEGGKRSPKDILSEWKKRLSGKTVPEQVDIILSDPLMNRMAAVEHRRWCNFFYLKGYSYAPVKDEAGRLHDCLVTDWEVFSSSDKKHTIIYDFLSVINLD